MAEVSKNTKELIQKYQNWHQSLEQKNSNGVSTIHVDEVASKVASFYEKLRKVVDWKEEHLFKKIAIERVLKRRIFFNFNSLNQIKDKKIAESFICELIRGGYFPNDTIDESKIQEVQKIIDKYLFILQNEPHFKENKSIDFQKEILEIAACEIEETISVPIREKSLIVAALVTHGGVEALVREDALEGV
ncbi:MAG: hypothetical protein U9P88_00510, partial [Patescibacteria group bacterium]|nr:hypothetical protein [Patescibacteria group bacterium]